jgi:hypothetical protein
MSLWSIADFQAKEDMSGIALGLDCFGKGRRWGCHTRSISKGLKTGGEGAEEMTEWARTGGTLHVQPQFALGDKAGTVSAAPAISNSHPV